MVDKLISIEHSTDRNGRATTWVTVEEDGEEATYGPHTVKRSRKATANGKGRKARPASAPVDLEARIAAAVKAAVAAAK